MFVNKMTWHRNMPPRLQNQDIPHYENSDGRIPPPPPPPNDRINPVLAQFIAEATRQFAEMVA